MVALHGPCFTFLVNEHSACVYLQAEITILSLNYGVDQEGLAEELGPLSEDYDCVETAASLCSLLILLAMFRL